MTKLRLNPEELEKILYNKFLFDFYSKMLVEDYEIEMSRFKYLGLLTNPDGYKKIEDANSEVLKEKVKNRMYRDGIEATQEISKLYKNVEEENIIDSE